LFLELLNILKWVQLGGFPRSLGLQVGQSTIDSSNFLLIITTQGLIKWIILVNGPCRITLYTSVGHCGGNI